MYEVDVKNPEFPNDYDNWGALEDALPTPEYFENADAVIAFFDSLEDCSPEQFHVCWLDVAAVTESGLLEAGQNINGRDWLLANAGELTVRVVYRDPGRGRELYFTVVAITISDRCPVCGRKRGEPVLRRYCDDGEWYSVHNWTNPCGHIDMYPDVIREYKARGKNNETY
jgi:hypothetical protein